MYADSSLTLVLNGAEARLQILCGNGSELLFSQEWFTPRHGMQVLVPALMEGLARMGLSLGQVGRIAIVRGPGSFTGLRLVLSTALGMARPLNMTMGGIGYMDALAADPLALAGERPVWTVTHARRGIVHLQGFCNTAGAPGTLCQPDSATLEDAAARIAASGPCPVLLGTGIRKNLDFFAETLPQALVLPERFDHPAPETLLALAQTVDYSTDPVDPLYIRPCDAEENLDSIAAAKGLNPEEARATLAKLTTA